MPRLGYTMPPLAQQVVGVCAECGDRFQLRNASQLGAYKHARNVFCSKKCCVKFGNRRSNYRHTLGPCPTCGKMFQSKRREKKYCSMKCYTSSPEVLQRLRALNVARRKDFGECPQCGKKLRKQQKYCSKVCWRTYFAERFDRWVANPEKIALPQCFDEFMAASELSCLVEGCDWKGKRLGNHVNLAHGITADAFRELVGFNRGTGLVTAEQSDAMAEQAKAQGLIEYARMFHTGTPPPVNNRKPRLEGLEHARKARAIIKAEQPLNPARVLSCRFCDADIVQPTMGEKLYCNTRCRSKYYTRKGRGELTCSFCGGFFMGNRVQVLSAQRGNKVCCSIMCRNRLNIVACLAAQGRSLPYQQHPEKKK